MARSAWRSGGNRLAGGTWTAQAYRRLPAGTVFDRLEREWEQLARSPLMQAEAARWADREPALAPGRLGAGAVVGAVAWCGYEPGPGGQAVLSALLRVSLSPLAARALLQALLPRLRAERVNSPTYGHGLGEHSCFPSDTAAQLVAECYVGIRRHAGEDRTDVHRLLVTRAVRRLRTARQVQRRYQSRTVVLARPDLVEGSVAAREALSEAEHLAGVVVSALQTGRLSLAQARLVYAARVQGWPAAVVGRATGMPPRAVYHALSRAEQAVAASVAGAGWCALAADVA
ncbi:MAG TPA: hypothetical protein VME46_18530 [Acidimicrobiales bacterium]|nr:hypothetical protein [Acidimicrobiales bacterium]